MRAVPQIVTLQRVVYSARIATAPATGPIRAETAPGHGYGEHRSAWVCPAICAVAFSRLLDVPTLMLGRTQLTLWSDAVG